MKFLIVLAVLFAAASAQTSTPDSSLRTRCAYFKDKLMLSCKGPSGKVECEAFDNFPAGLNSRVFGLGFDEKFPGPNRIRIYALRADNTFWINHQFMTQNQRKVSMSVHPRQGALEEGFRVKEQTCFDRLNQLFQSSTSNLRVPLSKVTGAGASTPRASLFGEVFCFDKSFN